GGGRAGTRGMVGGPAEAAAEPALHRQRGPRSGDRPVPGRAARIDGGGASRGREGRAASVRLDRVDVLPGGSTVARTCSEARPRGTCPGGARTSLGHFVVGIEGLALLRAWMTDPDSARARFRELAQMAANPDAGPLSLHIDVPPEDVRSGYARWAESYDALRNPLIHVEEPAVHGLVDSLPAGRALDAACGTGRHARHLRARGHRVIGVDATPEMLDLARRAVPDADFRLGDLTALPVETGSVDLTVCALALTH